MSRLRSEVYSCADNTTILAEGATSAGRRLMTYVRPTVSLDRKYVRRRVNAGGRDGTGAHIPRELKQDCDFHVCALNNREQVAWVEGG